jgi:hypothetical protein
MLGRSQTCRGDEKVRGISAPCPQERLRLGAVGPKRRSSMSDAGPKKGLGYGRCKAGCARQ